MRLTAAGGMLMFLSAFFRLVYGSAEAEVTSFSLVALPETACF
jgi:hypothetical protein